MGRFNVTQERNEEVMKLLKENKTYTEIGARFNITKNAVAGIISRHRAKKRREVFGDAKKPDTPLNR